MNREEFLELIMETYELQKETVENLDNITDEKLDEISSSVENTRVTIDYHEIEFVDEFGRALYSYIMENPTEAILEFGKGFDTAHFKKETDPLLKDYMFESEIIRVQVKEKGVWEVKQDRYEWSSVVARTKAEALKEGKRIAKLLCHELLVFTEKGKLQDVFNYRKDKIRRKM